MIMNSSTTSSRVLVLRGKRLVNACVKLLTHARLGRLKNTRPELCRQRGRRLDLTFLSAGKGFCCSSCHLRCVSRSLTSLPCFIVFPRLSALRVFPSPRSLFCSYGSFPVLVPVELFTITWWFPWHALIRFQTPPLRSDAFDEF